MVDQAMLRGAFGRFASGVTVVTCRDADGRPHGATMSAFTAVSLDPALCQVTPMRSSRAAGYLDGAPFAVNILAADQSDVALHFAGRPRLGEPDWADGPTAPLLRGAVATLSCEPWASYDGGDHLIVIGRVVEAVVGDAEPLVYFSSTFHDLGSRSIDATWNWSSDDPLAGFFPPTGSVGTTVGRRSRSI